VEILPVLPQKARFEGGGGPRNRMQLRSHTARFCFNKQVSLQQTGSSRADSSGQLRGMLLQRSEISGKCECKTGGSTPILPDADAYQTSGKFAITKCEFESSIATLELHLEVMRSAWIAAINDECLVIQCSPFRRTFSARDDYHQSIWLPHIQEIY